MITVNDVVRSSITRFGEWQKPYFETADEYVLLFGDKVTHTFDPSATLFNLQTHCKSTANKTLLEQLNHVQAAQPADVAHVQRFQDSIEKLKADPLELVKVGVRCAKGNRYHFLTWDLDIGKGSDGGYPDFDSAFEASKKLDSLLDGATEIRRSTSGNGIRITFKVPEGINVSPSDNGVTGRKLINEAYTGLIADSLGIKVDRTPLSRQVIWLWTKTPKEKTFELLKESTFDPSKHTVEWLNSILARQRELLPLPKIESFIPVTAPVGYERRIADAKTWLSDQDSAVDGQGGHNFTFSFGCRLVEGFALDNWEAWYAAIINWNSYNNPPWDVTELKHKFDDAMVKVKPKGNMLSVSIESEVEADRRKKIIDSGWDLPIIEPPKREQTREEKERQKQIDRLLQLEDYGMLDICNATIPKREWIIDGLIRERELLQLAAPSKSNKTWASYSLSIDIVLGRKWLGLQCHDCGVLYLDGELYPDSLQERLQELRKYTGDDSKINNLRIQPLREAEFDIDSVIPLIQRRIQQHPNIKVVFFDALYCFYRRDYEELNSIQMRDLYSTIARMSRECNVCVVLVLHTPRQKAANNSREMWSYSKGDGEQDRKVDAVISIYSHKVEDVFVFRPGNRNAKPIPPIVVKWKFPLFEVRTDLEAKDLATSNEREPDPLDSSNSSLPPLRWTTDLVCQQVVSMVPTGKEGLFEFMVLRSQSNTPRLPPMSRRAFYDALEAGVDMTIITKAKAPLDSRRWLFSRTTHTPITTT